MEISVSGFYKWLNDDDKEHRDGVIHSEFEVVIAVKEVVRASNGEVPGAVRLHHELNRKGFKVSHKRLVSIMKKTASTINTTVSTSLLRTVIITLPWQKIW